MEYKGNWHILVCNLPVEGEGFQLGSGLWIRPITAKLNVFSLAGLGAIGFREWAVLEPALPLCFSEICSAKDADTIPGYNALNRGWLALSLLCLKGYTKQVGLACSSVSWSEAEELRKGISKAFISHDVHGEVSGGKKPEPRFIGGLLDYHITMLATKSPKESLLEDDSKWVRENFESFNKLCAESEAFRFTFEAAVDWRYSKDIRAAISRIWAGIESILELKMETVYRLSTISASLLAKRGPDRIKKFKEIKKLYDTRSKAVHGGQLKSDALLQALDDSFSLLSELVLKCVEKGRVLNNDDFEQALFGE